MKRVFLGVLLGTWCLGSAQESDAVVTSAARALASGQAVAALPLLENYPGHDERGEARLLQAQALLVLGHLQPAAERLASGQTGDLMAWPERLRAAVALSAGEVRLANGALAEARPWLEQALRLRGGIEVDRALVLLAECCDRLGDPATARRWAHLVWRDWPRSRYRARAGLLEARLIAQERPDEAREVLAGVRALDQVEPGTRASAAELLCQLLLPNSPGQCLVVAEQELAHTPTAGRLPLWRALALARLDAAEGMAAMERLTPELRADPAVRAMESAVRAAPDARQDAALRIERARAELELGRPASARAILVPMAERDPAALALLASLSDEPLERWLEVPAMSDPAARLAIAVALARRGDHSHAWPLLQSATVSGRRLPEGISPATALYWAARSAQVMAPEHVGDLTRRLLECPDQVVEVGLAWAEEAQRLERVAAPADEVRLAWERAARSLPIAHAWCASATLRACRPLLAEGGDVRRAQPLLERLGSGTTPDQLRCRFLLAQVYERLGEAALALRLLDELTLFADAEQAAKLARMRARLARAGTPEIQPQPLDAEN